MRQTIRKLTKDNCFFMVWHDGGIPVPDSTIIVDFNPIILHLQTENLIDTDKPFCMVHYQARPKNLRRYGIWHSGEYSASSECIKSTAPSLSVCLDERRLQLPPNAVIVYPNSTYDPDRSEIVPIDP